MAGNRTQTQVQADLDAWHAARTAAADGRSITIATSAGSRTLTTHNMKEINETIDRLTRELNGFCATGSGNGVHNFARANFNHDGG